MRNHSNRPHMKCKANSAGAAPHSVVCCVSMMIVFAQVVLLPAILLCVAGGVCCWLLLSGVPCVVCCYVSDENEKIIIRFSSFCCYRLCLIQISNVGFRKLVWGKFRFQISVPVAVHINQSSSRHSVIPLRTFILKEPLHLGTAGDCRGQQQHHCSSIVVVIGSIEPI